MSASSSLPIAILTPVVAALLLIAPVVSVAESDAPESAAAVSGAAAQGAVAAPIQTTVAPSDGVAAGGASAQSPPAANPASPEAAPQSAPQAAVNSAAPKASENNSPASEAAQSAASQAGSLGAAPIESSKASPAANAAARKPGLIKRSATALKGLNERIGKRISAAADRLFSRAEETFPSFCSEWEHKLHDRETNNLRSIKWRDEGGWKLGRYLGYGKIKSCACKHSSHGMPVGSLSYIETTYDLSGKTPEEALHAAPKAVDATETTELFRWDKNHWAY